jgi:hypothetical protein
MNSFLSVSGSTKTASVSQKAFWISQGLLLTAAASAFITILNEVQKNRAKAAELLERFRLLEQQVAGLADVIETMRGDSSQQGMPTSTRSRSTRAPRSRRNDSTGSLPAEGATLEPQSRELTTQRKSSGRRVKKASRAPDGEPESTTENT